MAYRRFLISLIHAKTGLSRNTVSKLLNITFDSILDCLASDGWLEIPNFGRIIIRKFRSSTFFSKVLNRTITTDPKPYLHIKLRKSAYMYITKKLQELGIDWSSIIHRTHSRGKNMPPSLVKWFREQQKREELKIQ